MEAIRITLPQVTELASEIRGINSRLFETLEEVKTQMRSLSAVWESEGAEEIRSRFDIFSLRFAEQYETIENYAAFLDHTVSSYDALEATIKANAGNFS